jgi:plastocyanin
VDETEKILEQSAIQKTSSQTCGGIPGTVFPNNTYGYGRIDVLAAYNYAKTLVPPAPTAVTAVGGNASAKVSWTAPPTQPGAGVTSYTVTVSPGGATATVEGTSTQAAVTGLANGTAYTFTVTATNELGTSPASSPSNAVTPAATGTSFVSLSDAGFKPLKVSTAQGGTVEWDVSGTTAHHIVDASGMGLFDSGAIQPGSSFSFQFAAAGAKTQTVFVALKANPKTGTVATTFTVTAATVDATPPYVYDVQIAFCPATCTPTFADWRSGAAHKLLFKSSDPAWQGAGTYYFRGRLDNTGAGKQSGWSKQKLITVN